MNDGLRTTLGAIGAGCLVAAVVGGDVKVAGSELPVINDLWIRLLLAGLGLVLLWIAMSRSRRPRMRTWLVTAPTTTIAAPGQKAKSFGGGITEIEAASYRKSDDGRTYLFFDRDGEPTREIPAHSVREVQRKHG